MVEDEPAIRAALDDSAAGDFEGFAQSRNSSKWPSCCATTWLNWRPGVCIGHSSRWAAAGSPRSEDRDQLSSEVGEFLRHDRLRAEGGEQQVSERGYQPIGDIRSHQA
jgi:hypothetical protein